MADQRPYQGTTEPLQKKSCCSAEHLPRAHLLLKCGQLLFSLVAFICEEVINQCEVCGGLYFFEFMSCSAVLLTVLTFCIYCSPIRTRINIPSFKKIDFFLTLVIGVLFLIASIAFIATIEKTALAQTAAAFGFLASFAFLAELYFMFKANYLQTKKAEAANGRPVPEVEPLRQPVQENAVNP